MRRGRTDQGELDDTAAGVFDVLSIPQRIIMLDT
jgi:hypothetical protein